MTNQLSLGLKLRDEAFDLLERTRAEWIARALTEARVLIARDGYVTTDSLRDVCPVPEGVDARVVGAVLNKRNFLDAGPTKTSRRTSHGRPISKWILSSSDLGASVPVSGHPSASATGQAGYPGAS